MDFGRLKHIGSHWRDPESEVAARIEPVGRIGAEGVIRRTSVKDAMSRVTSYGYDALGRQISVSNPAIQSSPLLQKTYTLDGLVASLTDANSNTTNFASDGFDRLATSRVHLAASPGEWRPKLGAFIDFVADVYGSRKKKGQSEEW